MPSRPSDPTPPGGGSASNASSRTCPNCGATAASGRFCTDCGASIEGGICAACRSQLDPGAKFCHRCGTAVGAAGSATTALARPRSLSAALPWAIAGLVLVALVAFAAGRTLGLGASPDAAAAASSADAGDGASRAADAPPGSDGGPSPARAPDISHMAPRERADRLYDRIMRLNEEGKQDSVDVFAPMAVAAYQMLGPLDLDAHYDLGRIGEVTGAPSLAQAEADTILRADPTHLLGLALAARVAAVAHNQSASRSYYRRLVAAAPAEEKKKLPEYARHQRDIDGALAEARQIARP